MTKLIDEDGSEYYDTKDVFNCQRRFYGKLYSDSTTDDDSIESIIGGNSMKLSNGKAELLEGEISHRELSEAHKNVKNERSTGLDGFNVVFFFKYFILVRLRVFSSPEPKGS